MKQSTKISGTGGLKPGLQNVSLEETTTVATDVVDPGDRRYRRGRIRRRRETSRISPNGQRQSSLVTS
ncbi:hypothetical protein U1Q18_038984 [Sarracenia purpurea var. burkii]